MALEVPFVSNSKDDLHCLQAAYMIIIKFFMPDFSIDWEEWSRITGFEKNKGTWPLASLLWFIQNGFKVQHFELFDFKEFSKDGEKYLTKRYPSDLAEWAIEHTNVIKEEQRAKKLQDYDICIDKIPSIEDIKHFLNDGYLVRVHVNSRKLNGKEGYFGHAVVVLDYDDKSFTIHDPGLPPKPYRRVKYADFIAAWGDGDPTSVEMDAVKLKDTSRV